MSHNISCVRSSAHTSLLHDTTDTLALIRSWLPHYVVPSVRRTSSWSEVPARFSVKRFVLDRNHIPCSPMFLPLPTPPQYTTSPDHNYFHSCLGSYFTISVFFLLTPQYSVKIIISCPRDKILNISASDKSC